MKNSKPPRRLICTVTTDLTYDQRMIRICTALVDMGYDVTLVGRKKADSKLLTKKKFAQKRLHCIFEKGKFFYAEYNLRLFVWLLFRRVNIVYGVDLDTILPCFLAARLRRKVLIYDAHEYFTEMPEVLRRKRIQQVWERIALWTIPKIRYCITVGKGLADLMQNKYGSSFQVVRNMPFAQAHSKLESKPKPPIVLYQGALNEGRGLEAMIDAMLRLPQVHLYLAGEGDLSNCLRSKVNALNLQDRITFLGYVKPNELKLLTSKASIGLNLLDNRGLSYYYSLANKAFDYVQANVPSISMNFPEYQALNQEYEVFLLLEDLKVDAIVSAIQKLINDVNYYQKLSKNCALASAVWNWENEQRQLAALFHQIEKENF